MSSSVEAPGPASSGHVKLTIFCEANSYDGSESTAGFLIDIDANFMAGDLRRPRLFSVERFSPPTAPQWRQSGDRALGVIPLCQ